MTLNALLSHAADGDRDDDNKRDFFFSFRFPCALKGGQTWEREGSLFSELPDRVGCAQLEPGAAVAVLSA